MAQLGNNDLHIIEKIFAHVKALIRGEVNVAKVILIFKRYMESPISRVLKKIQFMQRNQFASPQALRSRAHFRDKWSDAGGRG